MLFLFALAISAQEIRPFYGPGTPVPSLSRQVAFPAPYTPVYAPYTPYAATQYYVPPQPSPAPAPEKPKAPAPPKAPSLFDLRQADLQVEARERNLRGNNLFYNTDWKNLFPGADPAFAGDLTTGFKRFGGISKAAANQGFELKIQNDIDEFRRTHPQMTWQDRESLEKLRLQRDSAHNQVLRRFSRTLPSVATSTGGYQIYDAFNRKSKQLDLEVAEISLDQARDKFREEQNDANRLGLRNAQRGVHESQLRRDGTTFDILGFQNKNIGAFAPVLRKKASETKLQTGYRNQRAAREALAKEDTEENRMNLQLANLFIRATEEEDQANKADVLLQSIGLGGMFGSNGLFTGSILSAQGSQSEAKYWLKYDRLKRRILQLKLAKAQTGTSDSKSSANPVAERMLGLSNYGPAALQQQRF